MASSGDVIVSRISSLQFMSHTTIPDFFLFLVSFLVSSPQGLSSRHSLRQLGHRSPSVYATES